MRSHAVLCIAFVAVAACSNDGVSIEVRRGSTTAERVELYVVDGYCTTDDAGDLPCPQLKTPSAAGYLDGEVYTREDARTLAAPVESDGVAYFTIRADGDRTRIPLAVAVGFDGNDKRVGAVVMPYEFYTTDANRHIVTLDEIVEDKVTGTPQTDGLRAETWYQDASLGGGCLALEQTFEGTSKRKFIVPADDLDCDGWMAADQECDAIWPDHGADDDSMLPFTCLAEESTSGNLGKRCILGDAPCIDGQGPPECKPVITTSQQWCVPSALCDPLCGTSPNPGCLYNALQHPMLPALGHPSYLHCTVPVQMTMANGFTVCRDGLATPYTANWSIPANTTCSSFSVGTVTPTQIGPFAPMRTSTVGPANVIKAVLANPGCQLSLQFAGDFAPATPIANALPQHVVKLDLTNTMSLVIPLVVDFEITPEAECTNADGTCELVLADTAIGMVDESLAACARF